MEMAFKVKEKAVFRNKKGQESPGVRCQGGRGQEALKGLQDQLERQE